MTHSNGVIMLDALRQVPIFANTPDEQLRWVTEQGTEVWLSTGERLITEGEPADYWYVLLDGELRITKKMAAQEALLNTYHPGTFFGEVDPKPSPPIRKRLLLAHGYCLPGGFAGNSPDDGGAHANRAVGVTTAAKAGFPWHLSSGPCPRTE